MHRSDQKSVWFRCSKSNVGSIARDFNDSKLNHGKQLNAFTISSRRECLVGGKWSGKQPVCEFVDCGDPPRVENGKLQLLDGRTTYGAEYEASCQAATGHLTPFLFNLVTGLVTNSILFC